jgi:predicted ATP-grasp superfamily ATP-dependent carboligase
MIQELIESKDSDMVMYNAYSIHGKPFLELTAQKIRNGPAVYGNSTVSKSKNIEEIILPSRKILEYIGYTGYCCIEYRRDLSDNRFKFLEINGRYNLSNYLLNGCGYNAPWMEYKYYLFNEIPSNSISFKENIYWIDIFRDLSYSLPRVIKGQISFTDYLRPYFSKHVFAILDFKDILPFLKRGFSILGNFLKNVNKSLAYKDKNR